MSMFGALNRFISRLDAAPIEEQQSAVNGAYGFQILRNTNQEVPLEPWFDFIIGINGRTIVREEVMRVYERMVNYDRILLTQTFLRPRCAIVLARR
jgi:hypothetical protein